MPRFTTAVITIVLCALFGAVTQPAHAGAAPKPAQVADELLVKFSPAQLNSSNGAPKIHAKIGSKPLRTYTSIGWQRVKLPKGMTYAQGAALYKKQAGVLAVEPNHIYKAEVIPNDPSYPLLWGMPKIGAPTVWNTTTGSSSVVVAVIDTGVDYTHPDLAANMWHNPREIPGNGKDDDGNGYIDDIYGIDAFNGDADPMDDVDHGTHCAGTIGAVGNNGIGVAGVNWNVKIVALKFLGLDGGTDAGAIECYQYAIALKQSGVNLRVISNSWGGYGNGQALRDIIASAEAAGIISICAAGNDTMNTDILPHYPSSYDVPSLLSIAASDENDQPAVFTNYGRKNVDFAAPGVNIYSTIPGGGYEYMSGTSMATPHVSGIAALLLSRYPDLTPLRIKQIMLQSTDISHVWSGFTVTGGRINLVKVMQSATPPIPMRPKGVPIH